MKYNFNKWGKIQRNCYSKISSLADNPIRINSQYPDEIWWYDQFIFNPQFFYEDEWKQIEAMAENNKEEL